jgi:hypothetical protein
MLTDTQCRKAKATDKPYKLTEAAACTFMTVGGQRFQP